VLVETCRQVTTDFDADAAKTHESINAWVESAATSGSRGKMALAAGVFAVSELVIPKDSLDAAKRLSSGLGGTEIAMVASGAIAAVEELKTQVDSPEFEKLNKTKILRAASAAAFWEGVFGRYEDKAREGGKVASLIEHHNYQAAKYFEKKVLKHEAAGEAINLLNEVIGERLATETKRVISPSEPKKN
jgi:hypothetical protein